MAVICFKRDVIIEGKKIINLFISFYSPISGFRTLIIATLVAMKY